ncbi:MAG: L-seryl-tRNA(Sec) selenium transferase [Ktedonobacterales bacterium]
MAQRTPKHAANSDANQDANADREHAQGSDSISAAAASQVRALPSVERLRQAILNSASKSVGAADSSQAPFTRAIRETLADARARLLAGEEVNVSLAALVMDAQERFFADSQPRLHGVINATGVILNTNLGRAPLSDSALNAIYDVAQGYSNLEYDLEAGARGSRQTHIRSLLRELTGAEDALVVNNNAAATLVALSALAAGREVVISRGELVEIGGGFRVPDVMRQSGARLVEVGTTNRTRLQDYAAAITPETALLLSVHPSNFRVIGFTEAPALVELARLAHERGLPLMHDLGSGALTATEPYGLQHEPTVGESVAAGADVICFSGDKLLGGPQAGILVGRADLLARIERHPLMRAVRIDKLTLAALEATLRTWRRDGKVDTLIPIWRSIAMPLDTLWARVQHWAELLNMDDGEVIEATVIEGQSTVGGGSLPGEMLPTWLCALTMRPSLSARHEIGELAALLRRGQPSVVARVLRDQLLLDPRTVAPDQDNLLMHAIHAALRRSSAPTNA